MPSVKIIRGQSTKLRKKRNYVRKKMDDIPILLPKTNNKEIFMQFDVCIWWWRTMRDFLMYEFYQYKIKVKTFVVDSTFKSVPQDFYQMITFKGLFLTNLTLIFIFITEKNFQNCLNAFDHLSSIFKITPTAIICDI